MATFITFDADPVRLPSGLPPGNLTPDELERLAYIQGMPLLSAVGANTHDFAEMSEKADELEEKLASRRHKRIDTLETDLADAEETLRQQQRQATRLRGILHSLASGFVRGGRLTNEAKGDLGRLLAVMAHDEEAHGGSAPLRALLYPKR